jgi:hypothetical protein
MAASPDDNGGLITGINVTPLVDVVLVLLIIFMATAPLIARRAIAVNVPRAATGERATAALRVTYAADRTLLLEKTAFTLVTLAAEFKEPSAVGAGTEPGGGRGRGASLRSGDGIVGHNSRRRCQKGGAGSRFQTDPRPVKRERRP